MSLTQSLLGALVRAVFLVVPDLQLGLAVRLRLARGVEPQLASARLTLAGVDHAADRLPAGDAAPLDARTAPVTTARLAHLLQHLIVTVAHLGVRIVGGGLEVEGEAQDAHLLAVLGARFEQQGLQADAVEAMLQE